MHRREGRLDRLKPKLLRLCRLIGLDLNFLLNVEQRDPVLHLLRVERHAVLLRLIDRLHNGELVGAHLGKLVGQAKRLGGLVVLILKRLVLKRPIAERLHAPRCEIEFVEFARERGDGRLLLFGKRRPVFLGLDIGVGYFFQVFGMHFEVGDCIGSLIRRRGHRLRAIKRDLGVGLHLGDALFKRVDFAAATVALGERVFCAFRITDSRRERPGDQ